MGAIVGEHVGHVISGGQVVGAIVGGHVGHVISGGHVVGAIVAIGEHVGHVISGGHVVGAIVGGHVGHVISGQVVGAIVGERVGHVISGGHVVGAIVEGHGVGKRSPGINWKHKVRAYIYMYMGLTCVLYWTTVRSIPSRCTCSYLHENTASTIYISIECNV